MNADRGNKLTSKVVGKQMDRVDGRLKVTGGARYSAEIPLENIAHAVIIGSTIARGRIENIDTSTAAKSPGVLAIMTHLNAPKLETTNPPNLIERWRRVEPVLQSNQINHYGQHIGVVVAETLEQARHAARLVHVTYAQERPVLELRANLNRAYAPREVNGNNPTDTHHGDIERGLREADVTIDATYTTPFEHHNPMEPHATTAHWQGDRLTLYNSTQYPSAAQIVAARTLRIPEQNVRIVNPFMGGGFGSKVGTRGHVILAAIAAKQTNRPVKLAVTREQMFTLGHRTQTRQRVRLGAKQDGRLSAIAHEIFMHTSAFDEFAEQTGAITRMMYESPNRLVTHRLVRLNLSTPTIMRAPGETPGSFALESAMDELADALKIDPIQLRLRNEPARDPDKDLPWSSRSLVECFQQGAARFGWDKRKPEPRSMRDDRYLIGYGVASATYPTRYRPASARAQILPDGRVRVQIAATDLGTGTYTILTQIAADALSVSPDRVQVEIGDSSLPPAPPSGGSWGSASFGSAVHEACMTARAKMLALASQDPRSPLQGLSDRDLEVQQGRILSRQNSSVGETYQKVLTRNNFKELTAEVNTKPNAAANKYSMHAFGANFVEVRVDPDTGEVRVPRFVSVHAAGRILNPKTARSQIIGGVIMGIGMALQEETHVDSRYGNFVNHNLGEYHVPVNADINEIEAFFIEENDPHVNLFGSKGVGEIGIVGVAAAVANAVYHATGKRIRDLPITPDKLL